MSGVFGIAWLVFVGAQIESAFVDIATFEAEAFGDLGGDLFQGARLVSGENGGVEGGFVGLFWRRWRGDKDDDLAARRAGFENSARQVRTA